MGSTKSPTPPVQSHPKASQTDDKSGFAVAGLVFAFIFPLLGLIFSIIGLKSRKHGLAVAGLIISIVMPIVWFFVGLMLVLVFATFSGVQESARDVERRNDIDGLNLQLEEFYLDKAYYPETIVASDFPGLDSAAVIDPDGKGIVYGANRKGYSYYYEAIGCGADNQCSAYNLSTTFEQDDSLYVKYSVYSDDGYEGDINYK